MERGCRASCERSRARPLSSRVPPTGSRRLRQAIQWVTEDGEEPLEGPTPLLCLIRAPGRSGRENPCDKVQESPSHVIHEIARINTCDPQCRTLPQGFPEGACMPRPSLDSVLDRVDEHVQLLHRDYGGLPRAVEADQILREIWVEDTYHSTALEGSPISRRQVVRLLEEGQASGSLTDSLEIQGYAKAARWVYEAAPEHQPEHGVPKWVVQTVHQLLVGPSWSVVAPDDRSQPGDFRKKGVNIEGSRVRTTPPGALDGAIQDWIDASTSAAGENYDHQLVHSAALHAWFERIHPFVDGNGRVGRLLLNFMLLQRGYPPAVFDAALRDRYLRALARADQGNPRFLTELMARAVENNITKFLIPQLAGEARLVPLAALAEQTEYTQTYLRTLAAEGRLNAVKEGKLWLSSQAAVEEYKQSKRHPGRPRRSERKAED